MDLDDLEQFLRKELVILDNDNRFAAQFEQIVRDGEARCFRDIDFDFARRVQQMTMPASPAPIIQRPPSALVILSCDYFTPVGTTTNRKPLERRQADWLRDYWPNSSTTGAGKYFAEQGEHSILIAPTLDNTYKVEIWFTQLPTSIVDTAPDDGTQTTTLSTRYPELLKYACAVRTAGFLKNYGAQADDPKMAMSWEQMYQITMGPIRIEEMRKKTSSYSEETPTRPPESAPVN